MAPTHVKRQAAPRAAAPKKAAARKGASDAQKMEEPAAAAVAVPSLLDVPEAPAPAAPAEEAPAAPESADAAPVAPTEDAPAPRASLLQALAAGQPVEAAPEAPAAPERVVKRDGRHEIWADGEGTVTVLVTADLFKATINGVPRYGYRGNLLTVSEAVAERGIRFDALTKEF